MLNICEIYHIYATYMTDEIVSHICTLFGTYIVHTCETIQLSYMPHICDIFHIYLTYMKCSIFYIFNLYVIYGTYMPKCMSYMEHICAAYMRCIYVVYMLAYMQTYMTTYMLHICMFRMGRSCAILFSVRMSDVPFRRFPLPVSPTIITLTVTRA